MPNLDHSRFSPKFVQALLAAGVAAIAFAVAGGSTPLEALQPCGSGARTLAKPGSRLYPDVGNGGYVSVHTDLNLAYDTASNLFLPGTYADLTIRATQCLSDFSFDFETTSTPATGPNLTVTSVTVDGQPATWIFKQPTYPGDPNGQDDPDPQAHAASNNNPVSASNPNPPACTPPGSGGNLNGIQCPASKLVITPASPIADGSTITVRINYTGRPGLHVDGDGTAEGWFRSNNPVNDGGVAITEPVGTMAWMPLNNHPSAKPTYDVHITTPDNKVGLSVGTLTGVQSQPPDANFPQGSKVWSWHSPNGIPSFLVLVAVGSYNVTEQPGDDGILYRQAYSTALAPGVVASNQAIFDQQQTIRHFISQFAGDYPFAALGNVRTTVSAAFIEQMVTQNTWVGNATLPLLGHLTLQQWLSGYVSEADFDMTFFGTGWGRTAELLMNARTSAIAAGGLGTDAGKAAFDASLVNTFNSGYNAASSAPWIQTPSNPTPTTIFSSGPMFTRPSLAFLALRRILDGSASRPESDRWIGAIRDISVRYGGGTINKQQFEGIFHDWLPNQSAGCHARLNDFFVQWFDTVFPAGSKPQITGPGLSGPNFYDDAGACPRAEQAIVFGALAERRLNDPDFLLTATASSGLPVAFSATGACSVNGATVHLGDSTGICTITASQAGDAVFKSASDVVQSFPVTSGIAVTRGGYTYSPITRRYAQTITLRNTTAGSIAAPVTFVLDNLSANARLFNAAGVTAPPTSSPYIVANVSLAAGQTTVLTLQFTNPTNTAITYDARVLAGPAAQ